MALRRIVRVDAEVDRRHALLVLDPDVGLRERDAQLRLCEPLSQFSVFSTIFVRGLARAVRAGRVSRS